MGKKKRKKSSKWNIPEGAGEYFAPGYNSEFISKHKFLSVLIVIVDIIIAVAPGSGFLLLASALTRLGPDDAVYKIFMIIGVLGSAMISLGIGNLWMSLLDQYLGHWFTLITLGCGFAVCAVCTLILALV